MGHPTTRLIVLRHEEPNASRYHGRYNGPASWLKPGGFIRAFRLGESLGNLYNNIRYIYYSPLKRTWDTARAVGLGIFQSTGKDISQIQFPDAIEREMKVFNGVPKWIPKTLILPFMIKAVLDKSHRVYGGESFYDVEGRAIFGLNNIRDNSSPGDTSILVTHGGVWEVIYGLSTAIIGDKTGLPKELEHGEYATLQLPLYLPDSPGFILDR